MTSSSPSRSGRSNWRYTSMRCNPSACAHSSSAARRGAPRPCSPRYTVLRRSTSRTVRPATATSRAGSGAHSLCLLEQAPRLILLCEGFDEQIEIAVEHALQLVQREIDAVVRHPCLWEVVRPDLLAAVAAAV